MKKIFATIVVVLAITQFSYAQYELLANKVTTLDSSTIHYPSTSAVKTALTGYAPILTPLTPGSVPFVGAGGTLTENNARFFYNGTTLNVLSVGNPTPLVASNTSSTYGASIAGRNNASGLSNLAGMIVYNNANAAGRVAGIKIAFTGASQPSVYLGAANVTAASGIANFLIGVNSSGTIAEKFRITNLGYVGLTQTTPIAALHLSNRYVAASAIARGIYINNPLYASANGDALVGIDIAPSYMVTGGIATLGTLVGGSGYADGTYPSVNLTGGAGIGANAAIVISGGAVTSVTINSGLAGAGYAVANILSADPDFDGAGSGTGFTVTVATITSYTGTTNYALRSAGTGIFSVSGNFNLPSLTASTALALDASKNIVSITNTGTGNNVLSANPTFTGTTNFAHINFTGVLGGNIVNNTVYTPTTSNAGATVSNVNTPSASVASNFVTYKLQVSNGGSNNAYAGLSLVKPNTGNAASDFHLALRNSAGTFNDALILTSTGSATLLGGLTTTGVNVTGLTPSTALATDASNNIVSSATTATQLGYLSTTTSNVQTQLDSKIAGAGTINYMPKFTAANTLGNSLLYDNGTDIGIGTSSPTAPLSIQSVSSNTPQILLTDITGIETMRIVADNNTNNFIGYKSGLNTISGVGNLGVGYESLTANTTGSQNMALGYHSLLSNTTGSSNIGIGYHSLGVNTTGANNLSIGNETLAANSTGTFNLGIGNATLAQNTTGIENTAIGYHAMWVNTTGNDNTSFGLSSLHANTTGNYNTAIGWKALFTNTTGTFNTALGLEAGLSNVTGIWNTFIGGQSGQNNTEGSRNTFIGMLAGFNNGGSNNVFLGVNSGEYNTGSNNVILGAYADLTPANAVSNSVFIGNDAGRNEISNNKLYIANSSTATPLIYGDFSSATLGLNANVGIGTNTPNTKLDVNGTSLVSGASANLGGADISFLANSGKLLTGWNRTDSQGETDFISNQGAGINGGFAFYNYDNAGVETQLLRIKPDGFVDMGMGSTTPMLLSVNGTIHTREVNVNLTGWPDYVFKKSYKLPSLTEVKTYIDQNHHLPDMPSEQEVAEKGLALGEMNKLLTKKVEELTLYLIEKDKQLKEQETINQNQEARLKKIESQLTALTKN